MKRILSCAAAVLFLATAALNAEELTGKWGSMDEDGNVEVTANDGKVHKMQIAPGPKFYDEKGKLHKMYGFLRKLKKDTPVTVKYDVKNKTEMLTELHMSKADQPEKK